MANEEKKLSHFDDFIQRIAVELEKSVAHGGQIQVRVHRPSEANSEETVFKLQYTHPIRGARTDELILFRDGTWRYIPW